MKMRLAIALLILPLFTVFSAVALTPDDSVRVFAAGSEFFVAPTGSPSGDGSIGDPWDLATALSHPSVIQPGDTIWLRGGVYGSGGSTLFTSDLTGTEAEPIILRQYPGERATVDGGIEAFGAYTWFWGFEITNSSTLRLTSAANRPPGLSLYKRGHRAINMVIHNTGHPGIGFWGGVGEGGEIYGTLLWGNGIYEPDDAGSAIYAQNEAGTRYIREVISFRNFTTGMKAYAEGGYVNGFHFEGNVAFDNPRWNMFGSGKSNPMEDLKLISNYTYRRPGDEAESVQFGYYSDAQNLNALISNNYFAFGAESSRPFYMYQWKDITVTGNTMVGQDRLVRWESGLPGGTLIWDNNAYYGGSTTPFKFNSSTYNFDGWKAATGFDATSNYTPSYPTGSVVFVRPNEYEVGRAHIIIYNWDLNGTVDVDVSSVLNIGANYEIRDAQNYFGPPVVSGIYDGDPVSIPMNLTEVSPLVGNVNHIDNIHTAPEFGAFVLISDTAPVPTPTPTPSPTPTPEPEGSTTWYFAEGYTGDSFSTYILVQNPNGSDATVDVTYLLQDGSPITRQHLVPANSRHTIAAQDPAEVGPGQTFATTVVSDVPVIAERAMYFANGGHNTIGVATPSTTWHLAEGYTGPGFSTYILVQNPNGSDATVDVTYLLQDGSPITRQHLVPANSRHTIAAQDPAEVGPDQAFATMVVSDVPVIVERAMYFANGGHNTIGVTDPSTTWHLAEGYTGPGFSTYILVQNPNDSDATVDVTYLLQDGSPITRQHLVPANSRHTIAAQDPAEVGPDQAFATSIVSDVPVIAERAMYFANGGHNTIGVTAPSTTWHLAEGYTGSGFSTYILIQNPNGSDATVDVTYLLQDGSPVTRQHLVPANSRHTIAAQDPAEVGPDQAFATSIVSDVPVIVERAMYFANGGHDTIAVIGISP